MSPNLIGALFIIAFFVGCGGERLTSKHRTSFVADTNQQGARHDSPTNTTDGDVSDLLHKVGDTNKDTEESDKSDKGDDSQSSVPVREPVLGRVLLVSPSAAPGGDGSADKPFVTIAKALEEAVDGDAVSLLPGSYTESVTTKRHGVRGRNIIIRSEDPKQPALITTPGRVLNINHSFIVVEDLIFDGQFGADDAARLRGNGTESITLRRVEIRNSGRDCLDMTNQVDVLIVGSKIHHCLWCGNFQDSCRIELCSLLTIRAIFSFQAV